MPLFTVKSRSDKNSDKAIAQKIKAVKKAPATTHGGGLFSKIANIKSAVEKSLGKYMDQYMIITRLDVLEDYIQAANENNSIAIDTETTGLDPMLDKIVGLCLYTVDQKAAYVPINHVSYITGERVDGQLTESQVASALKKLDCETVVMFNAKFDMRVIKNQLGVRILCTWDCYLASRLMNENEPHKGLKALHQKYILDGQEDEVSFDALFKGVGAEQIPISTFYLYAAHDPLITWELYEFQKQYMYYDRACAPDDRNGMNGVAWVFFNIEMPCVSVVADMEDNGIELDLEYARVLSERYNSQLQAKLEGFYAALDNYTGKIERYRKTHENAKLDDPVNIGSPAQLAVLLYDILGVESVDKKAPRGTGEAILRKIADVTNDDGVAELCNAILEYREIAKLLSTYIDKLPTCVNPNDGRIHCNFNQYGADTGRFSSSDPNLQNIPSHNKDIRKMFIATNEEKLVSTDTQQFVVDRWCEVECADEWKYADKIIVGDELLLDDGSCVNVCGVTVAHDKVVIDFT